MKSEKEIEQNHSEILRAKKRGNFILRQELKNYTVECTVKCSIVCSSILGVIFAIFGIPIAIASSTIREVAIKYDDCTNKNVIINGTSVPQCNVTFTLNETLPGPVYVYYQLDNFFTNHREFAKSRLFTQLRGVGGSDYYLNLKCTDMRYNWQHFGNDTTLMKSFTGQQLDFNGTLSPCGLIARAVFNDTYQLQYNAPSSGNTPATTVSIPINETNIADPNDIKVNFVRETNYSTSQWMDVTNEHFMVWMSMENFSNFYKKWGIIQQDLAIGSYTVIVNNLYDVSTFDSGKFFVLSSPGYLGSASFFGYALIKACGLCLCSICIMLWINCLQAKKFDEEDLEWY